ncbi:beta-lactamase/transpeptidase-like protein [Elsinoe ampelina]|uniref:Beta-lactamase/transpeptidase-like protein n=1 Tax=Elsinoe ampelina TaxID=302913 RepID=A0A6A6GA10_9PEZI|nr:beta-lactamase/transpeptidase-like protein [Elsinoe ampelina]
MCGILFSFLRASIVFSYLISAVVSSCIPDFPSALLSDSAIAQHPAVVEAFKEVERNLSALFTENTRDALSFAVVHASSPEPAFAFNHGPRRFNETGSNSTVNSTLQVDSDSIFRVLSVSKNIATFSALVVENESRQRGSESAFTLDTPVRRILPSFGLPDIDWRNGGSEITLSMLGTHSSGLPREGYVTDYNMVVAQSKATAETIGAEWASVTPESLIESFKTRPLMFAPGQRAAYSNAGMCLLAITASHQHNLLHSLNQTWSSFATHSILSPLNMTHSFFGPVPASLLPQTIVPGGPNWSSLQIGPGYDPAGGLWSSASDLVKYMHNYIAPAPELITSVQRRNVLQPRLLLPDGKQQVGFGFEIARVEAEVQGKTYWAHGKSGDGGGYHSWVDVVPNLGYGIVVLTAEAQAAGGAYVRLSPTGIRDAVHGILAPAVGRAVGEVMRDRYAGMYAGAEDTGLVSEEVGGGNGNGTSYARVEVERGGLFLREMWVNGTNALEGVDRLGWTEESQGRFFSAEGGVGLNPAEGEGERAEFGEGASVWRMIPELEECDWFDFDGYADANGWPLSKIVTVERDGEVEIRWPPFDVVMRRVGGSR